jgi:hypothetical protein
MREVYVSAARAVFRFLLLPAIVQEAAQADIDHLDAH